MTFARKTQEHRERREAERAANLRNLCRPTACLHRGTYAGTTSAAVEKDPRVDVAAFRNLARGEACTGLRYGGYCHCDPATTVLAHTNSLADGKGMSRKAHDHLGAFLGFDCHGWLDQGKGTAEEKAAFMAEAQTRTRARLAEIAIQPAGRPWRRLAARAWLDLLEAQGSKA